MSTRFFGFPLRPFGTARHLSGAGEDVTTPPPDQASSRLAHPSSGGYERRFIDDDYWIPSSEIEIVDAERRERLRQILTNARQVPVSSVGLSRRPSTYVGSQLLEDEANFH